MSDSGRTLWPETTVFWGAGATAALGMPVTGDQGRALAVLGGAGSEKDDRPLHRRLEAAKVFDGIDDRVADLLVALGDDVTSHLGELTAEQSQAATRLFPSLDDQSRSRRVFELRGQYDWNCFRQVIRVCPDTESHGDFLRDLFNILDMHILAGNGFHVAPSGDRAGTALRFLTLARLPAARNALTMLLGLMFHAAWRRCRTDKKRELEIYAQFCDVLAQLMQEEGLRFACDHQIDSRRFYLFSYAVISMNFDPILLWLLFNSQKYLNDASSPYVGTPAAPMKLLHDQGQVLAMRRVKRGRGTDIWYPSTEAAAQRLNDPEHIVDRRIRLGKFYMPHGCLGWRDCPNCGRATVYLGDEWRRDSETLLPPCVIALPGVNHQARPGPEQDARKRGQHDAVQCSYCGEMTYMRDTPLILQSSFKGHHPPYLEEIQRDMRVCLENTKHIVLMGYSLPPDDVIYRAMLSARRARSQTQVYCSVVVGTKGPDEWLTGDGLQQFVEANRHGNDFGAETIQAVVDIFGPLRVRAYTAGIPRVFGIPPSRDQILKLLYPVDVGIKGFERDGVCRERDTVEADARLDAGNTE